MNSSIQEEKENPVVTLKAQAEKFDFSMLRAGKNNTGANSGETMHADLKRMSFVINDKNISGNFINELYEEYNGLLPTSEDESRDYRPFAKAVFKEMFKYAEAKIPSDSILEELITNCNQSGYVGPLMGNDGPLIIMSLEHGLSFRSIDYTIHINCNNSHHATIIVKEPISARIAEKPEEELCKLDSLLGFTLESQDGKDGVTYKDGKLSLTAPERLKDYNIGDKSLFDIIKECFQKLCEKLGFFKIKIEHNLNKPLKVNSVEPLAHGKDRTSP